MEISWKHIWAAGLVAVGLTVACGQSDVPGGSAVRPAVSSETNAHWESAADIADLVQRSAVVAVVFATGEHRTVQVEGHTADGAPDPRFTSYYGVDHVKAQVYLKGSGADFFKYAYLERHEAHNPDRPQWPSSSYVTDLKPLQAGSRYLLFLDPFGEMLVGISLQPARWRLQDGNAIPETPSQTAAYVFGPQEETEFTATVLAAVSGG